MQHFSSVTFMYSYAAVDNLSTLTYTHSSQCICTIDGVCSCRHVSCDVHLERRLSELLCTCVYDGQLVVHNDAHTSRPVYSSYSCICLFTARFLFVFVSMRLYSVSWFVCLLLLCQHSYRHKLHGCWCEGLCENLPVFCLSQWHVELRLRPST